MAFLKMHAQIKLVHHDVSLPANHALLIRIARTLQLREQEIGVPFFVRGSRYMPGFGSDPAIIRKFMALGHGSAAGAPTQADASRINLPLLGAIHPSPYSLLALTAVMGLSDGLTPAPCGC